MSTWNINVNDGQRIITEDDGLYDVEVADTLNPFGSYAKAFIDDLDGEIFELLRRGAKVEFQYEDFYTTGFESRFVGFTVNELLNDADGAEQLEVEAYTFDQFLRGDEVSNDQSGKTIFEALEDVITTDVPPVDWEPNNVEVVDNVELTQSFQGETVEEFLFSLRQKSGSELPGVNPNLEFTFAPAERTRTRRDIDNSEWINHDIGEESGETKNQVKVSFADGDRSILVDDTGDQLNLQDNLGASGPGQDAASITRPEIGNFEDAIDAGEQFLTSREASLTGPVTTFELNDAEPGEVINVEIDPRGIDTEFRIAENLMSWRNETNELTVVAKKGADDDILIEQSKTLNRVEHRPRDNDVVPDRVTDTAPVAELPISVDAGGTQSDISRVVNDGRNRIRDGLIEENPIQSFEFVFSTTENRPSRSDSDIADIVDTAIPSVSTSDQQVTFEASTSESNINTVGIRDSDENTLIAVARLSDSVSDTSVSLTIHIENDGGENSLFTNTGLNLIRDILAGGTPSWPSDYAYGSTDSSPSETDTTLDTEVARTDLNELLIQNATSGNELESIVAEFQDPLTIDGDTLTISQTLELRDAEDPDESSGPDIATATNGYVDGQAALFSSDGQSATYNFTVPYTIPEERVGLAIRDEVQDGGIIDYFVNGNKVDENVADSKSLGWVEMGFYTDSLGWQFGDLEAGTNTFRVDVFDSGGTVEYVLDQLTIFDKAFYPEVSDWDLEGWDDTDTNDQLPGPWLYPDLVEVAFDTAPTRRNVTEARFESTWNNTENRQFVELANDGETFTRFDNADSGSVEFTDPDSGVDVTIGIGHFATDTTTTPTEGDTPQALDVWNLFANPDAITPDDIGTAQIRAIIESDDALGSSFAESGLIDSSDTLLTSNRIPEFEKQESLVISSERLRFNND